MNHRYGNVAKDGKNPASRIFFREFPCLSTPFTRRTSTEASIRIVKANETRKAFSYHIFSI